jgi:NitT/TauT family transport system ATP-binding protein
VIVVHDVSKTFIKENGRSEEPIVALDQVSLTAKDSKFVALIGPSGCGKTTLLRIVGGLISADSGSVTVDGQEVTGPAPDRAMVFQNFALLPWRTMVGNVELGLEARRVPARERRQVAMELIRVVGLAGFENHFPHELSGGMQQRAGLARALAVRPTTLLMDEPFGALDEQTRRLMHEDLVQIWEGQRQTVLFVTHSMDEAVFLSDQLIIMSPRPGRIQEVLDVPLPRPRAGEDVRHTRVFTELVEYTWSLLKSSAEANEASVVARMAQGGHHNDPRTQAATAVPPNPPE